MIGRAKELAERCGRRDVLLDLIWFEWSALATSCRGEESTPLAMDLRRLTADDPRPEVRATGHQVYGVLCWGAGRIAEAVEHLDIALALLQEAPPPPEPFGMERQLVSNTFWIWNHAAHGDLPAGEAFARFDALITAIPDRFAVASICGFAATTAVALGAWREVDRFARIGTEADAGAQFAFWDGQFLMHRGIVEAWQGDIDRGMATFAGGKARYTGIGARSGLSTFEASMAIHVAAAGRVDDATRLITNARAELEAYNERWNEPMVLMGEAAVARAAGAGDEADELLACAADAATAQGAHAFADRARRHAGYGDPP